MARPIPVARIHPYTKEITGVYGGFAEAARHNGVSPESIAKAVRLGCLIAGYEWKKCRRKKDD